MKKTLVESGVKRGAASGPSVRAISDPSASCLSHIRDTPSRLEAKAQRRPSGEIAGDPSRPEEVMYFRRGGGGGGGAVHLPTMALRARRSAAPTTTEARRAMRQRAGASAVNGTVQVERWSRTLLRSRARSRVES